MADIYIIEYDRPIESTTSSESEEVQTQHYKHVIPSPTSFEYTLQDIDSDGSGRNTTSGEMQRQRIGQAKSYDIEWSIIKDSKEQINLYRILQHLPMFFDFTHPDGNGEIITETCYRGDLDIELYEYIDQNQQRWLNMTTSFILKNLVQINDSEEPILLE